MRDQRSAMRALSVRQPYAEQILRGVKRIEYRTIRTLVRGRVYIYASRKPKSAEGERLRRGVVVGTVEIVDCTGRAGSYEWHLRAPRRLRQPRKPTRQPQPVWFIPFR